MSERTLHCTCGASATVEDGLSVFHTAQAVGWTFVASYSGTITYLCPVCGQEAVRLAAALHKIVQDQDLHFGSLLLQAETDSK
jgi:hypothetical protein